MKKNLAFVVLGLLLGLAASWVICTQFLPWWQKSAVDNTFSEVSAKLDKGGEVFAYLHTEELIAVARTLFSELENELSELSEGQDEAKKALSAMNMLFEGYGLDEVSGLGFSSITLKPGLKRSRMVLHHRPGADRGLIWNVSGSSPRSLDEINLLPADIIMAAIYDYDIESIMNWLGRQDFAKNELEQGLAMAKMGLTAAGIDGDRLLNSYGGSLGFLLSLEAERRSSLPLASGALSIPEPGLAFLLKVNDSYIFDLIGEKAVAAGQARISEESGIKKIIFPLLPAPIPLTPVIAQEKGWLAIATKEDLILELFAKKEGKLAKNKDFRALAQGLPTRGNGFFYLSPAFTRLGAQVLNENQDLIPNSSAREKMISSLAAIKGFCQVWENSPTGLVYTANHTFSPEILRDLIMAIIQFGVASQQ